MTNPDAMGDGLRALGRRLADLRQAAGYTQEALAPLVHYTRSTVANVETGRQHVNREFWINCDRLLATGGLLVHRYDQLRAAARHTPTSSDIGDASSPGAASILGQLRRQLLAPHPASAEELPPPLDDVRAAVAHIHTAYQQADYIATAHALPQVLRQAEARARDAAGPVLPHAEGSLAVANLAASKLAVKLGDASLAWVAADRASRHAAHADHPALAAMSAYSIACALLAMPNRLADAEQVMAAATSRFRTRDRPEPVSLSVLGALALLAALIAAQDQRRGDTRSHLEHATSIAEQLGGDRNDLWTGFGPTNVLIHRLGAATASNQPNVAIDLGERLDTTGLPSALLSRRAQVHLDLAAAFAQRTGCDATAVLHLLEAERLTPQLLRFGHTSRTLLGELLRREKRTTTPGLRALAPRAGVTG
jgi:DNA-binding XRE family transcriptional regulator